MRSIRSPKKTQLLVASLLLVVSATCGGCGGEVTETTAALTTPTAVPTTHLRATTTTTTTTGTGTTLATTNAATIPPESSVEKAVAYVRAWNANEFAQSNPPEGVLGPSEVVCANSGPLEVGGVFACSLEPNTSPPDGVLDVAGIVIYVLDANGRSAWTTGTDAPHSAADLAEALNYAGVDLTCEDLMDPDDTRAVPLFGGAGRPDDSAYFWSLVYWSLTGQPDRMDVDQNGVPCETLHRASIISKVLEGGPVY